MFRSKRIGSELAVVVVGAAVLFLLAFAPASGGSASDNSNAAPMTTPETSVCSPQFQSPENPAFLSLDGGACKAELPAEPFLTAQPVHGGRTCRCSCGFPCKTDADCGGGIGSCRGGISCC